MSDDVGGGDDELMSNDDETLESDAESHDLKVPCMGQVHYVRCACVFRIGLWTLVMTFQALPVAWVTLMVQFFSQGPSFITWLLNPGIGLTGSIEVIFSGVITTLAIVQLLQKGPYAFVHKCRVMFNVVVAAFLSHLLVFFALSFAVQANFPGRIKKEMRRELNSYKRKGHSLHALWQRSQEKYHCCGFGGDLDYVKFPLSCCRGHVKVNCTLENRWRRNCFEAEAAQGSQFMHFATALLGISIPFACVFYLGFRYFRPYWELEHKSRSSLPTLPSQGYVDPAEEDEEEESDDDP